MVLMVVIGIGAFVVFYLFIGLFLAWMLGAFEEKINKRTLGFILKWPRLLLWILSG